MKKFILGLLVVFISSSAISQEDSDYLKIAEGIIEGDKKEAIAQIMDLTPEEEKFFCPIYDNYNDQLHIVQTKRINLIKRYAENAQDITDELADEIFTALLENKLELAKLNKLYYNKFKKVLFAGKAAKYLQAENKIATMVDYEIAVKAPYVQTD